MTQKGSVKEINRCELNALIERVEHAIEYDLALSVDDLKLLLSAITTLCELQSKMEQDDTTLFKLRKLLGMVKQSESRSNTGEKSNKGKSGKKTKSNSKSRKNEIPVVIHRMTTYEKGDVCPHCERGKLYKYTPGVLLRITGHAPFEAIKHITEQYRCNACQDVFKAALPEEVLADGDAEQQYGFSARALMALSKFYTGTPYHHQSNFSNILGLGISPSTIFDQCQHVANSVEAVHNEFQKQAANAKQMDIDDTRNRILGQQPELRKKRNSETEHLRSGVYTSGLIATLDEGHEIILFETSLGHAGEHLDNILAKRSPELPPPIVMSDALGSNTSLHKVIPCNCNSHCRRLFYDLQEKFPKEIEWLLDAYGKIWKNDSEVREDSATPKERLDYHKALSLPVMEELKSWAEKQIARPEFEEHSAFGKAVKYLLRHYDKLVQFCHTEGAKIDNNRMEERLKIVIRGRKTAHFYKTQAGANVANILTSVIATADVAGINLFDYLCDLQRHRVKVKQNPSDWVPWKYQKTLSALAEKSKSEKVV